MIFYVDILHISHTTSRQFSSSSVWLYVRFTFYLGRATSSWSSSNFARTLMSIAQRMSTIPSYNCICFLDTIDHSLRGTLTWSQGCPEVAKIGGGVKKIFRARAIIGFFLHFKMQYFFREAKNFCSYLKKLDFTMQFFRKKAFHRTHKSFSMLSPPKAATLTALA